MAHIVLAHGILGFGDLNSVLRSPYFNGVRRHLERLGHQVLAPSVPLLGSLDTRARELAEDIDRAWPTQRGLYVLAHSMGGLDIRRAVARFPALAQRVAAIACIATPHYGSPVADAVLDHTHPLWRHVPPWLRATLDPHAGALADLRTRTTLHDEDVPGIRYAEVGCDCSAMQPPSPLFALAQAIGGLDPSGNDGVVTLASAQVQGRALTRVWSVDHGGAIGWPTEFPGLDLLQAAFRAPRAHLQRYEDLLALIS